MADNKNIKLTQDKFEFVQAESKIYDKRFETKPIGYFKDAMIRFSKNRTNVVATSILFMIILGTIIIPIVSTKNFDHLEEDLVDLPPRMPLVENIHWFGWHIFDGTSEKTAQAVDLETIDPVTGIGLPLGYAADFIIEGSLVNYVDLCSDRVELCVGGENTLRVTSGADHVTIISPEQLFLVDTNNPMISLSVTEINGADAELRVYTQAVLGGEFVLVETITSAGDYEINPLDAVTVVPFPAFYGTYIKIEFSSTDVTDNVVFETVTVENDTEVVKSWNGYELALWDYDSVDTESSGLYLRQNGELLFSEFRYDEYGAALANKTVSSFPASEYNSLLEEYGYLSPTDACYPQANPNPLPEYPAGEQLVFGEDCPIKQVYEKSDVVTVDGVDYFSYRIELNVAQYKHYDEIPFFLFGTDKAGRDLFTLLWVATRTSLLIGVIVASINISVGIVYGSISGYYGGKTDILMQRFAEVIGRIPWLVTLSIFIALFGPGISTLILILIVSGWIGVAAITRTQFYRYKGREYVLASRTLGAKDGRLIFRHILPNGIGTIITSSILTIPYVIFAESTISYLGFGIGHGQSFNFLGVKMSGVSIGVLLADGRAELLQRPYLTLFPALLISVLMITFNMFGNALRDAFNPALRGSE